LPSLDSLILRAAHINESDNEYLDFPVDAFSSFAQRSNFQLKTLELREIPISATSTLILIDLVRSLVNLKVRNNNGEMKDFLAGVFSSVILSDSGSTSTDVVLPKLQKLEIKTLEEQFACEDFVKMVKSRGSHSGFVTGKKDPMELLKEIKLFIKNVKREEGFSEDALGDMRMLVEAGMRIHIHDKQGIVSFTKK
jgi:hypothetical protein